MFEGMSSRTNHLGGNLPLNHGQPRGVTSTPCQSTSIHVSASPINVPGAPPVPTNEALQKAVQKYVKALSDEDKEAFRSAPDIMEQLEKIQCNRKHLISSSLTTRVEKVLQCIKTVMSSLGIFIQHNPEISSLVVGSVNCIMTVSATCYSCRSGLIYYD